MSSPRSDQRKLASVFERQGQARLVAARSDLCQLELRLVISHGDRHRGTQSVSKAARVIDELEAHPSAGLISNDSEAREPERVLPHRLAHQLHPEHCRNPSPLQPGRRPAVLDIGGEEHGAAKTVLPAHQYRVAIVAVSRTTSELSFDIVRTYPARPAPFPSRAPPGLRWACAPRAEPRRPPRA